MPCQSRDAASPATPHFLSYKYSEVARNAFSAKGTLFLVQGWKLKIKSESSPDIFAQSEGAPCEVNKPSCNGCTPDSGVPQPGALRCGCIPKLGFLRTCPRASHQKTWSSTQFSRLRQSDAVVLSLSFCAHVQCTCLFASFSHFLTTLHTCVD